MRGAAFGMKQDRDAEGLAVADEITVPATLVRVAVDVDTLRS
ncbi:MAG: hypothetical protein ACXVXW_15295 [Mycobacteriaceae bacterium]